MHLLAVGGKTTITTSQVVSSYTTVSIEELKRELEIKTYEVTELSRKLTKSHEQVKRLAD